MRLGVESRVGRTVANGFASAVGRLGSSIHVRWGCNAGLLGARPKLATDACPSARIPSSTEPSCGAPVERAALQWGCGPLLLVPASPLSGRGSDAVTSPACGAAARCTCQRRVASSAPASMTRAVSRCNRVNARCPADRFTGIRHASSSRTKAPIPAPAGFSLARSRDGVTDRTALSERPNSRLSELSASSADAATPSSRRT